MVTFPEEIHPKHGKRLRFEYAPRAFQYLDYFKITMSYPTCKFIPLNITFNTGKELSEFLYNKGIVYDEITVSESLSHLSKMVTVVDSRKIYDIEEGVTKYLLNYRYYSVNEVAELLSLSRPSIYKLINGKSIQAIRIQGQLRINHLDLIKFINAENPKNAVN
jgi:excisionase family DNA binding protein